MPTDVCHRHCKFCGQRSTGQGDVLPLETAAEIVRQVAGFKDRDKKVCVTGGGEPLEYPHLVELFQMLLATNIDGLAFVTSGCKDESERGFQALEALSGIKDERLYVTLSVNYLHQRTTIQRLRFTLPYLEKMSVWLDLRYILDSMLDIKKSLVFLRRLGVPLLELGYCHEVDDLPQAERDKLDEKMLAGVNKHWFGKRRMYKNPVLTLGSKDLEMSYDNVIEIELQQIEICGRAADYMTLSDKARMRKEPALCQYLASSAHRYLDVRASGDIFPCPCVDWHPQMRLGNIADMTLREALAAKTAKMRWARERRKANPFDPDVWMQCYRCYTD